MSQTELCTAPPQVSKQEGRAFFYCVRTLTFTFPTVVCLIKWVDLAHFCQVPFISQSSLHTGQNRACWKMSPPWPVLECCKGCPSLDVIPGEGMPCCNSLVLTACLSVYLGNVSLVFIRPQSAHRFRCDIDAASHMLAGWRTQPLWSSCLFEQECFNRDKICDKRSDGLWTGFFVWRRAGMQRVKGDFCMAEFKRWCIFCLAAFSCFFLFLFFLFFFLRQFWFCLWNWAGCYF